MTERIRCLEVRSNVIFLVVNPQYIEYYFLILFISIKKYEIITARYRAC